MAFEPPLVFKIGGWGAQGYPYLCGLCAQTISVNVFLFLFFAFHIAVEKVAVICRFLDIHSVTKNHLLKYSLAHAFCCFLTAVEDVNPAVATRAGLLLDTIKRPALQVTSLGVCCLLC